jgi:hypothetical protein
VYLTSYTTGNSRSTVTLNKTHSKRIPRAEVGEDGIAVLIHHEVTKFLSGVTVPKISKMPLEVDEDDEDGLLGDDEDHRDDEDA